MITMYKDGKKMEVNDNPDGVAILKKNGWTTEAPKAVKNGNNSSRNS